MIKTKVLIIESNLTIVDEVKNSLNSTEYLISHTSIDNGKIPQIIKEKQPDIILFDCETKEEVINENFFNFLKSEFNLPIILLVDTTVKFLVDLIKEIEPQGVVAKPLREIDLICTIEIALQQHQKNTTTQNENNFFKNTIENHLSFDFIFVKSSSKLIKINTKNIYFIEALKDYVIINTQDKKYTIHSTMKDIEKKLGNNDFSRVHRSFIVRLDKIASIDFPNLLLEDKKKMIPIGGLYKSRLMEKLNLI